MAVGRTPGAIRKLGSGYAWYQEVNADGTALTSPDTWHLFPIISSSKLTDKTAREGVYEEDGFRYMIDGNRDAEISGESLQSDDDFLTFLTDTTRGKYYAFVKELNRVLVGGDYQYVVCAAGTFDPSIDVSFPGRTVPWQYVPIRMTSATTVTLTGITGAKGSIASSTTVDADAYYKLYTVTS